MNRRVRKKHTVGCPPYNCSHILLVATRGPLTARYGGGIVLLGDSFVELMCYTLSMQQRSEWSKWAESLRRFKLDGFAVWLLEAGGPLTILGAQAVYLSQPFLGGNKLDSLAHMLEEDEESQAFARYLRGEYSL